MKIKLENVRLAFTNLFEPKAGDAAKPDDKKFSTASLFPDADPVVKVLEPGKPPRAAKLSDILKKVAADKWGVKGAQTYEALKAGDKLCIHNGNAKSDYEGYSGNYFINANNKARPTVIGADKSPLTAQDGKPYAGCYANVIVELWAQDNNFGKRINASLSGVQFVRDGDAFAGGSVASADDFDSIEEGADAESMV